MNHQHRKSNANIYLAGKNKGNILVFFLTPRTMAILALGLYPHWWYEELIINLVSDKRNSSCHARVVKTLSRLEIIARGNPSSLYAWRWILRFDISTSTALYLVSCPIYLLDDHKGFLLWVIEQINSVCTILQTLETIKAFVTVHPNYCESLIWLFFYHILLYRR